MGAEPGRREALWRVWVVLLVAAVPLVIFESVLMAWHVPVPEFQVMGNDPARVFRVIAGSGAEAAGVQAGDRILQVNGEPFGADNLPQVIRHWTVGERLAMLVQHADGTTAQLSVPLVPVAAADRDMIERDTVAALLFWAASLLLLRQRFQSHDVRVLFLLAQAMALVLLFPPLQYFIWYHAHPLWANVTGVGALMSTALLLHFHCSFPVSLGSPRQRRRFLGAAYGLTLIVAGVWIAFDAGRLPWIVGLLLVGYLVLAVVAAMAVLLYSYRRRATPDGRRRLRVILFGNLVAGAFMAFLYLLPLITLGYPLISDLTMLLALALAPAAYVYATVRHNLFDLDRLLNRALVYVIIAVGIFALYLGPLLLLDRLLPYDWARHAFVLAGITLVLALAFEGTRRRVQQLVDRFFYGGWYDYPKVVELVSAALARSLDWDALTDVLARQVPQLMQLGGAELRRGAEVQRGGKLPVGGGERPAGGGGAAFQPKLQFPLGGEGEQRAVWLVGPRRDGDELSGTDQRILKTLARQASIAASNVRLVQTLRRQLDEILASRRALTRLEHQLLRMREAERERLARDLHDGPIQALVGLKMQLDLLAAPPGIMATKDVAGATKDVAGATRDVAGATHDVAGVTHDVAGATGPAPAATLRGMQDEVRTLLVDLRQVCADLRPPMLDTLGLGAALRALARDWSAQHETAVQLGLADDASLQALPGEVAVNLYRVAQESLANVARHAQALTVSLRLEWIDAAQCLRLTICDDGQGFEPSTSTSPGHFGLAAMRERAALIGGQWRLQSAPGQGTTITVHWLPQRESAGSG